MTALLVSISFNVGIVLGYLASKRGASKRASQSEHPVEFGGSLDLDPSQRARLYEGRQ